MAATEILPTSNVASEGSSDVTVAAGTPAAFVLKDASPGCLVSIQVKTDDEKYTEIGMISSWIPQTVIIAPGEYRCVRRQGECGVVTA